MYIRCSYIHTSYIQYTNTCVIVYMLSILFYYFILSMCFLQRFCVGSFSNNFQKNWNISSKPMSYIHTYMYKCRTRIVNIQRQRQIYKITHSIQLLFCCVQWLNNIHYELSSNIGVECKTSKSSTSCARHWSHWSRTVTNTRGFCVQRWGSNRYRWRTISCIHIQIGIQLEMVNHMLGHNHDALLLPIEYKL